MPKSKQITKKVSNSEWVRRRNKRKWARKLALKHFVSRKQVVMADTKKSIDQTPLKPQSEKPKGFFKRSMDGIRNVFAGRNKNSRGVV
tara:strand:+ start:495 stop:758 length:264 start_codon:yes stop_codon:yes gene_type:complete